MKIASLIARVLLGIMFLVFGLNGFLNFIPQPPFPALAMQFFGTLYASHYTFVIFGIQLVVGALLLTNLYVPLAVILLAPIIVNIFFFHLLMAPSGLPPALFVVVLWLIVAIDNRPAYDAMLQRKLSRNTLA